MVSKLERLTSTKRNQLFRIYLKATDAAGGETGELKILFSQWRLVKQMNYMSSAVLGKFRSFAKTLEFEFKTKQVK